MAHRGEGLLSRRCSGVALSLTGADGLGSQEHDAAAAAAAGRNDGKTAMHWAARNGCGGVLAYLLRLGGPGPLARDGTTPLHLACYGGHVAAVRCLLDANGEARPGGGIPAALTSTNNYGCGPAHWAALGGHVKMVEWLALRGVPLDTTQVRHVSSRERQREDCSRASAHVDWLWLAERRRGTRRCTRLSQSGTDRWRNSWSPGCRRQHWRLQMVVAALRASSRAS